ncbi:DnaT-like ssDNA-binding domain-containing protein [Nitrincola alkalilacustris]|uniref:DnaT-like ssDNA-binding domain-containing protein n=1 Tax=Nitrincola alkalilacustris TaxID=1571224 RepID=UPI00124F3F75|nr:DnaT-like ssDNA-binding domain-containing protein [Nitrincola alkalilacustris]
MTNLLPEKPLLFYPSLARKLGSDEALLLFQLTEQASIGGIQDKSSVTSMTLSQPQWRSLADFWDAQRQMDAANSLARQGVMEIQIGQAGTVTIRLKPVVEPGRAVSESDTQSSHPAPVTQAVQTSRQERMNERLHTREAIVPAKAAEPGLQTLPVFERPPPRQQPQASGQTNLARQKGPAPTFGGSLGWRRQKDELQDIFEQHEERNQRLQSMHLGWQPSEAFHELLPRHAIPAAFAADCLDEFVLYWLDKDRRESNWDQKYLAWVKREWVKKQTRDAREQRYEQERNSTGINNENTQRDTRDKRKRVTAAIMDLKDTDW